MKTRKQPKRKRVNSPFSKNLKVVMEQRNLSLRAVAEICGVNPAMIHAWREGAQPQNSLAILKLCNATAVDFQWLLTGIEKNKDTSALQLRDIFTIENDPHFSGMFLIEAKRLSRKVSKE